jgi:tetratricopeptide (TPR) repeat protein
MSDWLNAEGHADRALEMYERGRWAEAEAELRKAIALNPDHAEWHFNLALTLEAAGRDAEALASYQRAIELLPGQIDPLLSAGIVANRLGRFEPAMKWLEQALKLDRLCEPAYSHLMESYLRLERHEEVETMYYIAQQTLPEPSAHCLAMMGESLLQRREYRRAGWCLKEALRLDSSIPRVRARLASVFAATGRTQKALQLYLRDLRDDPGNIDTLLDYGELLMEVGRLPEAAEKFRRVLELEPANVDAHYRLGEIAMRGKRYEKARLEFELVLKLDQQFPQARLALAEALLVQGWAVDARRHLRHELEAADLSQRTDQPREDLVRLGTLLLSADMPSEAAQALERAAAASPTDLNVLRRLALARFQSGDRLGGVAVSRRVLRLEPRCVRSMHNLALAALEDRRLRLAWGWIRRGLRIDRHDDGLRRLRMRVFLYAAEWAVRRGWSWSIHAMRRYVRRLWRRGRARLLNRRSPAPSQ